MQIFEGVFTCWRPPRQSAWYNKKNMLLSCNIDIFQSNNADKRGGLNDYSFIIIGTKMTNYFKDMRKLVIIEILSRFINEGNPVLFSLVVDTNVFNSGGYLL